jgi:hypothetical protein
MLIPTPPPPTTARVSRALQLSRPSIEPGGQLVVRGSGCPVGANVRVSIDRATVGTAVADGTGGFSAAVVVPNLALGRYDVVADCGPTLAGFLDVVVESSVDAGTGVLGLFFFFFLLSIMLFRRRRLVWAKRVAHIRE